MANPLTQSPPSAEKLAELGLQATESVYTLRTKASETINGLQRQVDDLTDQLGMAERKLAGLRKHQEDAATQRAVQRTEIPPPAQDGSSTPGTSLQNASHLTADTPAPSVRGGIDVVSLLDDSSDEASQAASALPEPVQNRGGKRVRTDGPRRQSKKAKLDSVPHALETAYNIDKLVYQHHTGDELQLSTDRDLSARVQEKWPELVSNKHIAVFKKWLRNRTSGYCLFGYVILKKKRTTDEEDTRACRYCVANGYPYMVGAADGKKFKLLPAKPPASAAAAGDGDQDMGGLANEPHFEYF